MRSQVGPLLITIWSQVRALPGSPRTSTSYSIFVALCATTAPETCTFRSCTS